MPGGPSLLPPALLPPPLDSTHAHPGQITWHTYVVASRAFLLDYSHLEINKDYSRQFRMTVMEMRVGCHHRLLLLLVPCHWEIVTVHRSFLAHF